jgi:hypothetical protein
MADISAPALEKASAKLKQLVPSAHKVDIQVGFLLFILIYGYASDQGRFVMCLRKPTSKL